MDALKNIIFKYNKLIFYVIISCLFMFSSSSKIYSQNNFTPLKECKIIGIGVQYDSQPFKWICQLNGFVYGRMDYGIYKQRGYFFAVTLDNALMGEGVMMFETVSFNDFTAIQSNNSKNIGIKGRLKQMDYNNIVDFSFYRNTTDINTYFLSIAQPYQGQYVTMLYILYYEDEFQSNNNSFIKKGAPTISIEVGEIYKMFDTSENSWWESDDPNIAFITKDGFVKGISPGKAYIWEHVNSEVKLYFITVK